MKRGKPMKRTPLKRGTSKLQQTTPLKKRSDKMSEKYVERRKIVAEYLKRDTKCTACVIFAVFDFLTDPESKALGVIKQNNTQDVHELINRSQGGSILDDRNLIAVCRKCHSRITTHPSESERVGLHLSSWCNTDAHFNEALRVRKEWYDGRSAEPYWFSD